MFGILAIIFGVLSTIFELINSKNITKKNEQILAAMKAENDIFKARNAFKK